MTKPVKCGAVLPGKTYPPRRKPYYDPSRKGLGNKNTKLSKEQVLTMQSSFRNQKTSFTQLAKDFGVSVETASNAAQGLKAYKDVH